MQERHWDDLPYIIRLVQNHLISHPEGEGFNAVVSGLAGDNERLVDELCVSFLQGIESHEADSNERRRLLGLLEVHSTLTPILQCPACSRCTQPEALNLVASTTDDYGLRAIEEDERGRGVEAGAI